MVLLGELLDMGTGAGTDTEESAPVDLVETRLGVERGMASAIQYLLSRTMPSCWGTGPNSTSCEGAEILMSHD